MTENDIILPIILAILAEIMTLIVENNKLQLMEMIGKIKKLGNIEK